MRKVTCGLDMNMEKNMDMDTGRRQDLVKENITTRRIITRRIITRRILDLALLDMKACWTH